MSSTSRYVIRGARVLSQDPKVGNFDKGDILVEGSRIAAVGADLGPLDAVVIDGTDRIAGRFASGWVAGSATMKFSS